MTDTAILPLGDARKLNINGLANDLVLFGEDDLLGVLAAHAISEEQLVEMLVGNEALRQRVKQLRQRIEGDPMAVVRMKATSLVEAHIRTLNTMIADTENKTSDRLKGIELAAQLADAMPKQTRDKNVGMVVQLNMGSIDAAPTVRPVNVLEQIA